MRLCNQAGIASSYHQLGMLAHDRGDYDTAQARYQQSLTINERLGNQAGMATSYHQLGMLAQNRGDYDTAQARYEQSLTISERLGNQAGMATSISQMGILAAQREDLETATRYHLRALLSRAQLGIPQRAIDAAALRNLTKRLPPGRTAAIATEELGPDTAQAVIDAISQFSDD